MCLRVLDEGYPSYIGCAAGEEPERTGVARTGYLGRLAMVLWEILPCPPTQSLAFSRWLGPKQWKEELYDPWR